MRQFRIKVVGGKIERALSGMKKKWLEFGIMDEVKERQHFTKPSLKKRQQMIEVKRKNKRNNKTEEL